MTEPSPFFADTRRWRCDACGARFGAADLAPRLWVCTCGTALPMPARERLALLADPGSAGALQDSVTGGDPLGFRDVRPYPDRLEAARQETGLAESFVAAACTVGGVPSMLGALDFQFMGGTLSPAVGERVVRVFEQAADERRAVVLCTSSGGARMQEGTLSLFQMAKTAAAVAAFRAARRPYVAVLCHPTMGGVAASFGSLADVLLAEPGARIGFAGPRVVEQTLGHPLPPGFQHAEFLVEHGMIDRVIPRPRLREELVRLLPMLAGGAV